MKTLLKLLTFTTIILLLSSCSYAPNKQGTIIINKTDTIELTYYKLLRLSSSGRNVDLVDGNYHVMTIGVTQFSIIQSTDIK